MDNFAQSIDGIGGAVGSSHACGQVRRIGFSAVPALRHVDIGTQSNRVEGGFSGVKPWSYLA
ncbi:hypothetical protein N7509_008740 [Penicillium cosmopolitanum]|uniref:Uncharacterized protein n=1 Tax=Penicillium cosmopolitanum TaxID=1131564 RepID=A0A9W9VN79_9EURO|nr:uncharacterized protein N7509_008740 [Penicillium cosmopolitanum]KAJ5386199.1 hypothetical protein N7509_008740 [Penicillium cosmopolitanum]